MFIINLLILPAAFITVFAMALFGGAAEADDGSGGWKALRAGPKLCYLAAVILPLTGVFLVSRMPDVWPSLRAARRILLLAVPGLLLGLANLILAFRRRPRKCLLHWHILLTLSLLPSLALAESVLLAWLLRGWD